MSGAEVLIARGVRFAYPGGPEILRGVDLAVARGEVALLWGLNGAGKTTLGKVLAGLYKPKGGVVERPAGPVGMVLASPEGMLLGATPAEDVRLGPALAKLPEAEVERRTRAALALVKMVEKGDCPCDELSLGERKRVALAAAFALAPAALILDEPFAFLDDEQVVELVRAIERVAAEGTGILIMSGRRRCEAACGRAWALREGVVAGMTGDSP